MECALKIIKNQKYIFDDVYNYFKLQDWEKHLLQAINSKEKLIKIGSVYEISGE